jgi:hypothetical protein
MQNASDFHPKNFEPSKSASFNSISPQIMEILEKGSSSEEEDTPTKPEARFSKLDDCDKTTHQWIQNSNIN